MMSQRARDAVFAMLAAGAMGTACAAASDDVTGPVLTKFNAAKVFDASRPAAAMTVDFRARDDLSGVLNGSALARGPDGIALKVFWDTTFFKKLVADQMSTEADYRYAYLKPGVYTFTSATFYDAAGNQSVFDQAQLAALGNTSFTLVNSTGYDNLDPTLRSGKVLTPKVSPGSVAGVRVDATDSGESAVSGLSVAYVDFCALGTDTCFSGYLGNTGPPGMAEWSARVAVIVRSDTPPGTYHLRTVLIQDHASGSTSMKSLLFGGTADFSLYFPSTTITVAP